MRRLTRILLISMLLIAASGTVDIARAHATPAESAGTGHWEGDLVHESQRYPIALDVSLVAAEVVVTLDLPEYLIYGSKTEVVVADELWEIVPQMLPNARLTLQLQGDRWVGRCEDFWEVTSEVELRRARAEATVYVEEELSFDGRDATLAGTLLLPSGDGPFPIIVWTHASGCDTRETFYYAGRAHLLAQNGIASLIYDKRGCGESTGEHPASTTDLIADAIAGIESIKGHSSVDASAIGIAGFSQGGWIAPGVAAVDDDIAFVVVGATPAVTGGEQNIYSMKNRMLRDEMPESSVDEAEAFVSLLYDLYETGEGRDEAIAALESARAKSWFESKWVQSVIHIPDGGLPDGRLPYWSPYSPDPMENWRKVEVPVLSMWGGNDIDVPVELSRERIEATLTGIGNTEFRLEVFPNASHGMWRTGGDDVWDWPRQEREAHQLMVDWVLKQTSG